LRIINIIHTLTQETLFAIKTVGFLSTLRLYFSGLIDRLFEYDKQYDLTRMADPKEIIPHHPSSKYSHLYMHSRKRPFLKILNSLDLKHHDIGFVDFGSGKGATLIFSAQFGIKKITGVEFCDKLSEIALNNISLYKDQTNSNDVEFKIINCDMLLYSPNNKDNLFYFYNPCSDFILSKVIQNILNSFAKKNRWGLIIYQNNLTNSQTIFDKYQEFTLISFKEFTGNKFFVYKISM